MLEEESCKRWEMWEGEDEKGDDQVIKWYIDQSEQDTLIIIIMSVTHVTHHQQTEYSPTLWAVLLHQIPHVNITFHKLETEGFRPDSELYLEALGIIGSVPAAWLILTLIILLIYLLTRCCDTKNNKVSP